MSTPIARSSVGLRNALFDELDALRSGTSNANRANAVAKIAAQVLETVRIELQMQRYMTKIPPGNREDMKALPHVNLG